VRVAFQSGHLAGGVTTGKAMDNAIDFELALAPEEASALPTSFCVARKRGSRRVGLDCRPDLATRTTTPGLLAFRPLLGVGAVTTWTVGGFLCFFERCCRGFASCPDMFEIDSCILRCCLSAGYRAATLGRAVMSKDVSSSVSTAKFSSLAELGQFNDMVVGERSCADYFVNPVPAE